MDIRIPEPLKIRHDEAYSYFIIYVDDKQAKIYADQKLANDGLIFLGSQFEDITPPLVLPPDPDNGRPKRQKVYGFVRDPDVLDAYAEFHRIINQ